MYRLLTFLLALVLMASCRSGKELPGFSDRSETNTEQSDKRDSVHVIEKQIPYFLPGTTVYKQYNLDSLKAAYLAGQAPRYIYTTDKKGLTQLQTRIDLLTGQLESECRTRDSVIVAQQTEMYRFQKEITATVKELKEEKNIPAPEKSWYIKYLEWPIMIIFLTGCYFWIKWSAQLLSCVRWPWRRVL